MDAGKKSGPADNCECANWVQEINGFGFRIAATTQMKEEKKKNIFREREIFRGKKLSEVPKIEYVSNK